MTILTVTFIIQNPKTLSMFSGWGFIIMLFLIGNYLMIRSFRRIWADRLIKNHMKAVDQYIVDGLREKDPWLIKFIFSINPSYRHIPIQDLFYNCIWDYERMIKDYSVWSLDKMIVNKELFEQVYKKDSYEVKNKNHDV